MANRPSVLATIYHDLGAGFTLLTRIPIPWVRRATKAPDLARSLWTYPVVGACVSGLGAGVLLVATALNLPVTVGVLLAMTAMIVLTGAFHEDGLADMADGFGGGWTVERKLEIMRDSRLGTYGAVTLAMALALKASILVSLGLPFALTGLVITGALSRMGIVVLLRLMPPTRPESLANVAGKPRTVLLLITLALGISLALILGGVQNGLVLIAGGLVGTLATGVIAHRQIGGFTGDVLGASQQVSELMGLLCLLIMTTALPS